MNDFVLFGRVLTVDSDRRVHRRGAVYVHEGVIETVQPEAAPPPAGFGSARRVRTAGLITPGLIDLHNHLAYNTLPLWTGRDAAYKTRYQWPGAPTYQSDVSNPAQALGIAAPAAALRYAEVKAVVGGVTAIQGSPPVTRAFPGWMVRNVEKEPIGVKKPIFQSVLPATPEQLDSTAARMAQGRSFIYHLGEGIDPVLRKEFTLLDDHGCVGGGLIGIHSTALTAADYDRWRAAGGGAVVWSPFSNLWLYGGTTDVLAARAAGLRVCLGSDWTPSGTRNVLGELKVAATWNDHALGAALSDAELVEMATANPGDTLARAWGAQVGRLVPGALADIAVWGNVDSDPWRTVLRATERHVRLVIVGGRPAYGNLALLRAIGAEDPETITVAGVRRGVVMNLPEELLPLEPDLRREATKSWADGLAELAGVWTDPGGSVRRARGRRAVGEPTFEFVPDMPSAAADDTRALDDDELDQLVMPTFDGVGHDGRWLASVALRAPAHADVLKEAVRRF
ncbi:MAG TPA: amidohydrolase family protein [Ilumatobacter sp.]|nr:amidohydrolase family protein [Ilumatobacter sp.]